MTAPTPPLPTADLVVELADAIRMQPGIDTEPIEVQVAWTDPVSGERHIMQAPVTRDGLQVRTRDGGGRVVVLRAEATEQVAAP